MLSRRSASILRAPHQIIGTTLITDCRSTKRLGHTPGPVTRRGSIGGDSSHERSVPDDFHGSCCDRPSPLDGRRGENALHLECIKQRPDRPLSRSTCDTVDRYGACRRTATIFLLRSLISMATCRSGSPC